MLFSKLCQDVLFKWISSFCFVCLLFDNLLNVNIPLENVTGLAGLNFNFIFLLTSLILTERLICSVFKTVCTIYCNSYNSYFFKNSLVHCSRIPSPVIGIIFSVFASGQNTASVLAELKMALWDYGVSRFATYSSVEKYSICMDLLFLQSFTRTWKTKNIYSGNPTLHMTLNCMTTSSHFGSQNHFKMVTAIEVVCHAFREVTENKMREYISLLFQITEPKEHWQV